MSTPTPAAPDPPTSRSVPRGWLVAFAVLAAVFVASAVVLVLVVRPPSYEPVPVPSVSRT